MLRLPRYLRQAAWLLHATHRALTFLAISPIFRAGRAWTGMYSNTHHFPQQEGLSFSLRLVNIAGSRTSYRSLPVSLTRSQQAFHGCLCSSFISYLTYSRLLGPSGYYCIDTEEGTSKGPLCSSLSSSPPYPLSLLSFPSKFPPCPTMVTPLTPLSQNIPEPEIYLNQKYILMSSFPLAIYTPLL